MFYQTKFELRDYLIHFPNIHMRKARKSHTCECCGCEIPKGDYYYSYKPYPDKKTWFGWRKRCLNHKPLRHNEIFYYEDLDAKTIQRKKFANKTILDYNKNITSIEERR